MGDTATWEFAAVVAAVTIGLGGMLLFTLVGVIGSWRMYSGASRAAAEAAEASVAVQDAARRLTPPDAPRSESDSPAPFGADLSDLRRQAETLLDQQSQLRQAVADLVAANATRGAEDDDRDAREIGIAVQRLDEHIGRVTAAVANLDKRR